MTFRTNCSFEERDRWIGLRRPDSVLDCSCANNVAAANCDVCRQSFVWLDGTRPRVTRFSDGEPDDSREQCVRVTMSGKWAGYRCDDMLKSVCQRGKIKRSCSVAPATIKG